MFRTGPDAVLNENEMVSSAACTSALSSAQWQDLETPLKSHHQGTNPVYCTDLRKNCNMHFSELSDNGSSKKGFSHESQSTKRPREES